MRLFAGFLAGSALAANPFPRAATDVCEVDVVQGQSCSNIRTNDAYAQSGVYKIKLPNLNPFIVECVFEDGFAYTVIQKRTTGNLLFNRSWADYKNGFTSWGVHSINPGKVGQRGPRPDRCTLEEYWIGLDNIYALTDSLNQNTLRIDMQRYNGKTATIGYDNFVIGNERANYRLESVGDFTNDGSVGSVGNSFTGTGFGQQGYSPRDAYNTNHIGMDFSTFDKDNDKYYANCAEQDSSGWWFNRCSAANLNGKHYGEDSSALFSPNQHGFDDGILWQTWTNNKYESLIGSKMMVASRVPSDESKSQLPANSCQDVAVQMAQDGKLTSSTKAGILDGVYQIRGMGANQFIDVDCKIMICGREPTGWTLMQKRYDGSVDFNRNWDEYKNGFGFDYKVSDAYRGPRPRSVGEGWLGNDLINVLTEGSDSRGVSLLIELERRFDKSPNTAVVGYERFSISSENGAYRLDHIDGFVNIEGDSGNAFLGDDFGKQGFGNDQADTNHKGMKFSTKDRDNDNINEFHCAKEDVSGWWFNACSAANLNGHYYNSGFVDRQTGRKPARGIKEYDDGVLWQTWTHDKWESLMTTRMWLAPAGKLSTCKANLVTTTDNNPVDPDTYTSEASSRDYESSSSSFGDSSSRTDQ